MPPSFAPALRRSADAALERSGAVETFLEVAGLSVRLRFAGRSLAEAMLRAFAHVRVVPNRPADLDVIVWDSELSGVPLPEEVGRPSDHVFEGLGQLRQAGRVLSLFEASERTLTVLDPSARQAIHWLPDARLASERDRAAPLQTVFNWWLPAVDRPVLHGAAVGTPDGAVLLLGRSAAGKSTTALACIQAGFHYLADDLFAVSGEGALTAWSLYCSAKVSAANLERFSALAPLVSNRERLPEEKAILYVDDLAPGVIARSLPVRALIALVDKGSDVPRLQPISPATALRSVAPAIFHNFPGHGKAELAGLRRLVASVPSFEMTLGSDIDSNPQLLRRLLCDLASGGADR